MIDNTREELLFYIWPLVMRLLWCLETSCTNHTAPGRHIPGKRRQLRKPKISHHMPLVNPVCLIKILESDLIEKIWIFEPCKLDFYTTFTIRSLNQSSFVTSTWKLISDRLSLIQNVPPDECLLLLFFLHSIQYDLLHSSVISEYEMEKIYVAQCRCHYNNNHHHHHHHQQGEVPQNNVAVCPVSVAKKPPGV